MDMDFIKFLWISWNFHPGSPRPALEFRSGPRAEMRPGNWDPASELRSRLGSQIQPSSSDPPWELRPTLGVHIQLWTDAAQELRSRLGAQIGLTSAWGLRSRMGAQIGLTSCPKLRSHRQSKASTFLQSLTIPWFKRALCNRHTMQMDHRGIYKSTYYVSCTMRPCAMYYVLRLCTMYCVLGVMCHVLSIV